MPVKMLRYAAVEPVRVAVIHIRRMIDQGNFSFFGVKSKYSNSFAMVADDGMVVAKKFRSLRGDVCVPSIANQQS
jgi:hypothetical protein